MAIPLHFSRADVEAMIAEARLFAAEWAELRAQQRNRMHGYCLRAPLKVDLLFLILWRTLHCKRALAIAHWGYTES